MRERGVDGVAFPGVAGRHADGDVEEVARGLDDAFGEEKAGGEFAVVAGCAHDDCEAAAFHADLQRLLERDEIGRGGGGAVAVAHDLDAGGHRRSTRARAL